ncbi:MAG TPA: hypothetical protein VF544_22690 [Pyrinomonadaceae bacterium]|jgi:hypothetical protein
MEKEDIKRAAEQAVSDLRLDCEITDITRPLGKDAWCIQFTGSYGQFCDDFHDKAGQENSARVIREKIKRFFLKQRKPVRIIRGKASSSRRSAARGGGGLLDTLLAAGEQVFKEASRITGEVMERAGNLNEAVLKTEADWIEGVSPTAAALLRPGEKGPRARTMEPPQRNVEPVESAHLSGTDHKPASRTVISKPKAMSKDELVATTKAPEDSRSQAGKKRAAKKRASKTAAKKSAAKKRSTKRAQKKRASKKKKDGKSR